MGRSRFASWVVLCVFQASCARTSSPAAAPAPAISLPPMLPAPSRPFDGSTAASLTESMARLFRGASPAFKVDVVESLTLHVDATDTDKHALGVALDRVWAACQSDPAHCEESARSFVKTVVDTIQIPQAKATRDQVVAVLRPRAYFDSVGGPLASGAVVESFIGDLFVTYVVDMPQAVRSLSKGDMTTLGLTRADLPSLARANLARRLGNSVELLAATRPGNVSVVQTGNYFESSRLLLTEDWVALAATLAQPMYAAVPANDVLVLAAAPATEQLGKLRTAIQGLYTSSDRPVSPQVYRWDAGRWNAVP